MAVAELLVLLHGFAQLQEVAGTIIGVVETVRSGRAFIKRNDLEMQRAEAAIDLADDRARHIFDSELAPALVAVLRELHLETHELKEAINELRDDPKHLRLIRNVERAAEAEPDDERLRMLAHAEAAAFNVRMHLAEKARVERCLRELDPLDVLTLYGLNRIAGTRRGDRWLPGTSELTHELWNVSPCADTLVGAGCIRVWHKSGGAGVQGRDLAIVTELGRLVLKVMRSYTATRQPPFEVPGREVIDGSRSENEASIEIERTPGLRDALRKITVGAHAGYDFPKWTPPPGAGSNRPPGGYPPSPNGKGVIRIMGVDRSVADTVLSLLPDESPLAIPHGSPMQSILGIAQIYDDTDKVTLEIHGPHDVLRWLADENDAHWV